MRTYVSVIFILISPVAVMAQSIIPISSIEELQQIGNDPAYPLDGNYVLTQDINASETIDWNDNRGFIPIGSLNNPYPGNIVVQGFSGHLDGQGYAISNLHINQVNNPDDSEHPFEGLYVALFMAVEAEGSIENLRFENCSITGFYNSGILAGKNLGLIRNCQSMGAITGTSGDSGGSIGGLVGFNAESGVLIQCRTSGTVTGNGTQGGTGGLVGLNHGAIDACSSNCAVTGISMVGGLVGKFFTPQTTKGNQTTLTPGTLTNSYAEGSVWGNGVVGGLVGGSDNSPDQPLLISDCYATGTVFSSGEYGSDVGGLIGLNCGSIIRCHATGNVTGQENVGGLVGNSHVTSPDATMIFQCHAGGAVEGLNNNCGGLVGSLNNTNILQSFATGSVTSGGMAAGGLVGLADGNNEIINSYAAGAVHCDIRAGGLVGWSELYSSIAHCYATGPVSSVQNGFEEPGAGGLTALSFNVVDSFWDTESSGQIWSMHGEGLNTAAMKQKATFKNAGWDFLLIWGIDEGQSYPCLQWSSADCKGDDTLSVSVEGNSLIRLASGSRHTFNAMVSNAIGAVSYEWYYESDTKIFSPIIGATNAEFTILEVLGTDSGWYYCEVSDDHFTAQSDPVHLLVLDNLSVTRPEALLFTVILIIMIAIPLSKKYIDKIPG